MHSSFITQHGVFLEIFTKGILLQGPPGCGKSDCALALLSRGAKLVADDAPIFYQENSQKIMGRCPATIQNALEIRALGIVDVRQIFGSHAVLLEKNLDLIIQFSNIELPEDKIARRTHMQLDKKVILGVPIPLLSLPLAFSQNMAILIESAVKLAFTPP